LVICWPWSISFQIEQETEKEYVEGYEFEEEDDIEDFGAFAIHESQGNDSDDENGNILFRSFAIGRVFFYAKIYVK
jgi:hypothetical protein